MANTFNDSSYIGFFVGTQGEYDALVQHDKEVQISGEGEKILKDGALYHITDDDGKAQGVVMLDGWPIGWKSGIQGLAGSQGAEGTQGEIGTQGIIGTQGPQGFRGSVGEQGSQGYIGTQGIEGPQGPEG